MIKCIGVCSKCNRCKNSAMMNGANDRKLKILMYPDDFASDRGQQGYGIAFDIGTTTVVGMLWDLDSGILMESLAETNSQNEFGMDVISRITFCSNDEEKRKILQTKIVDCLNLLIEKLCEKNEIVPEDIVKVLACGNTTMAHLMAGYNPTSLALAPFSPAYTGTLMLSPVEVGLNISVDGQITVLPNIAGHVGGDITAGIVACRFLENKNLSLFIDIGTNGEIVITDGYKNYTCSTAAGSAFEGASILYGMRAANGAIEKVFIEEGEVFFKTIGECEPQGICGSGIIDVIAQLLEHKLINKNGRLAKNEDVERLNLHSEFKKRLIVKDKERGFILVHKDHGEDIVITQNDIRQIQLAKGAIAAGITLMLAELGLTEEDIEKVVVAGAFGNYIDKESAIRIGLLPQIHPDKIEFAGNTAGVGVSMALVSRQELKAAMEIPIWVEHVELADKPNFQDVYMNAMAFR